MSANSKKNAAKISLPLVIVGVLLCFYAAVFGHSDGDNAVKPTADASSSPAVTQEQGQTVRYNFKSKKSLQEHFEKHGADTYCKSAEEYLEKANAVINNPDALTKIESDEGDGDRIFYLEETDEIVFLSTDEFIRTYFICSGRDYFDKQ